MNACMISVNIFRTRGGSLGVAVFGSLFIRAIQSHVPDVKDAYLNVVTDGTHHLLADAVPRPQVLAHGDRVGAHR
ncbi:hypothetical protein [Acrocarpospora sp. B8E8]|uniref:hypothetical protein n=1 Tax=Acrocarpospora sp. B8E8 TaxID=3153572 RepID=UPI00325E3DB1